MSTAGRLWKPEGICENKGIGEAGDHLLLVVKTKERKEKKGKERKGKEKIGKERKR